MVKVIYETEVVLNNSKNKIFAVVLYGRILVCDNEVCKIPLELDTLTDDMYYATLDYEVFITNWEIQRVNASQSFVDQLLRFYQNIEVLKVQMKEKNE